MNLETCELIRHALASLGPIFISVAVGYLLGRAYVNRGDR